MNYYKNLFGIDSFGNTGYHVVVDECSANYSLINGLKLRNYSVLPINGKLKGISDVQVALIAILNNSVIITSDLNFHKKLKKNNWPSIFIKNKWGNIYKLVDKSYVSKIIRDNYQLIVKFFNESDKSELKEVLNLNQINILLNKRPINELDDFLFRRAVIRGIREFNGLEEVLLLEGLNYLPKKKC